MKKILLFLTLLYSALAFGQQTAIPDPNFEQALIDLGYDSGTPDGLVLTANIETVTSLNISNKNISDLTGIKVMTSLEDLTCSSNNLTFVDFSSNTNLRSLVIASNSLNSLDLSSNVALENLLCTFNNLSVLDLSANVNLKILGCSSNNLTSLNLASNLLLEQLWCARNNLTDLNLSNNIALEVLRCESNAITQLDLRANTSFVGLDCEDNALTSLDLRNGNNTNFTIFQARNNPNLFCVNLDVTPAANSFYHNNSDPHTQFSSNCSLLTRVPDDEFEQALIDLGYDSGALDDFVATSNIENITDLDISNRIILDLTGIEDFVALTTLNCGKNNIATLDLSENTALETLICDTNQLTNLDLSNNIALEYLDCSLNQLTALDLNENENIQGLVCIGNELNNLNIKNGKNTNITTFNATSNPNLICIDVDNAAFSTANWTDIDSQTSFSEDCSAPIAQTFVPDDNFEQALINLGYDSGPLDDFVPTANIETVTSLQLFDLNIADLTGIEDFAALTSLNCSSTDLTVLDLSQNTALTGLNCSFTAITDLDLSLNTALTILFCQDTQLETLNLRNGNNVNVTIFNALNNPNLECIQVDDEAYSTANWTDIDAQTRFSEDCSAPIAQTFVPDDNFEQALIDLGYDSGALDDFVPTANIETVGELDIAGKNIVDLTGIEDFTALSLFNSSNNQIASIDLSQNIALERLDIFSNQLTSIDLSQNTILGYFDCSDNKLNSLNLSENSALLALFCANNELTTLNVKNGSNSGIATAFFNTTNNPNLNCIQVDDEVFSTSNWTNIDPQSSFSEDCSAPMAQTFVPDDNFELALIDLGYDSGPLDDFVPTANIETVTSLFIPNKNIMDLTGIEDFVSLTSLFCNDNQLTSLDISQNIELETLRVFNNQLTSLDLSQNTKLLIVLCANNELQSLDISQNLMLRTLNCTSNQITTIDLSQNLALESVFLTSNQLSSLDVSQNVMLTELFCQQNEITTLDLSQNLALETLLFSSNQLTSLDVSLNTALNRIIVASNQLTSLNVKNGSNTAITNINFNTTGNPNLDCIEVDDLTYSINSWTNIDPQTNFSEDCSAPIVQTFVPDDNFEQALIDLGYDSGPLDDYVPTTNINTVTSLDVSENDISDLTGIEDFAALINLRCNNNELTNLDLSGNQQLVNLVANINQLSNINLSQNTLIKFVRLVQNELTTINVAQNSLLEELYVSNNQITAIDLSQNPELIQLVCHDNLLTSLNLNQNTQLQILTTYNNQLTTLDVSQNSALDFLSCRNNQLSTLDLSQNIALTVLDTRINLLNSLNFKNGNNTNVTQFEASNNPNLNCIEVDDEAYSSANWTDIDPQTSFSEDCSAPIAQTFVPDDNFEQALIDLGYDSGALDDFVPTANIETVTDLNVFNEEIADLTGIEDFVALTALNCSNNSLTVLDLSQNTLLTSLDCWTNQITNLNISEVSGLSHLDCSKNRLTNLNLSQNTYITTFNISSNRLINLNVKNGNNTNIVSFNALNNPDLSCIEVDNTAYSNANWIDIDSQTSFSVNCSDTTAPVITLNGANPQIIELGEGYTELGATTDDGSAVTIDASEFMDAVGSYTIYYNSTDSNGNVAAEVTRIVNVLETDDTPPVITLNGANPQIIELGEGYTELGAITDDASAVTIDASEFMDALGSYTIYYNSTDSNGNVATEVTRTVNVVETDDTPPVITLNGPNPQIIELGEGYTELGATTDDASTVIIDASEFRDEVDKYFIRYNATDSNGNVAIEVVRIVDVIDTTPPVITLNGANPQIIELGEGYTELGATTDDGSAVTIDASEFMDALGSYTIYYNSTDSNGNVATEVTRTVNVVETDDTPPVITLNGPNPQIIELGEGYTELGATTDDGSAVTIDASEFMDAAGSYTIYYNSTDSNGNVATEVTRIVTVFETDDTPPVITLNGPNPQIIELGDGYTELGATTDDGSAVTIDTTEFMNAVGSYTIYYNATDENGNEAAEVTRIVNVIDSNAMVEVENGFSPNGDNIRDFWVIQNLQNYPNHEIIVYNRWGNKVFQTRDYQNTWDGTSRASGSRKLPVGPYMYIIEFNDSKTEALQGWVYINY